MTLPICCVTPITQPRSKPSGTLSGIICLHCGHSSNFESAPADDPPPARRPSQDRSMTRALRTCLTVLLVAVTLRAYAAEPKPDFSIKTKWVEASVILDAKIKADPALAANCLAEGKKWAE